MLYPPNHLLEWEAKKAAFAEGEFQRIAEMGTFLVRDPEVRNWGSFSELKQMSIF